MRIFPIFPETKIHLFFPRSKSAPINISSQIRTINHRPHLTLPSMSISSMWDVKEPTHYSRRVGHEVLCLYNLCINNFCYRSNLI